MPGQSPVLNRSTASYFGACLAVLLYWGLAGAAAGQPSDAPPPDPEAGQAVAVGTFNAAPGGACFQCHGQTGEGDAAAAFPRLTGQSYGYLVKSLKDYASGARENEIMSPIAEALTEQEMRDVSAYYAGLEDDTVTPESAPDVELLQYGAALAAVGSFELGIQGCLNCHGPDGAGLGYGYPYLAGQHASYTEAQLRAWQDGSRTGDPLDIMANIATRMSDREIAAVAAYYASLPPFSIDPEEEAQQ